MNKTRFTVLLGVLVLSLSFVSIVIKGANAAQNAVTINASPDFEVSLYDYGDALDPPYPVLSSNNGAYHIIDGNIYLGTSVDAESDGNPTVNATGDDNAGIDDEDGVNFNTPLIAGQNAQVTIEVAGEGYLNAWIDFNVDYDWDDLGEHVIENMYALPGVHLFQFFVPPDAFIGEVFARFRFSIVPGNTPAGYGEVGEVEDYFIEILDNAETVSIYGSKWNDLDADGIHDLGEEVLPGWIIQLTGDEIYAETETNESGIYSFLNLPPGTYRVEEKLQPGWEQTYPTNGYYTITLSAGETSSGNRFGNRKSSAIWEKYLYDHLWESPGITLTFEVSSYIDVEDFIYLTDPGASFVLTEEWNSAHLELISWDFNFGDPIIDHENGVMQWIVPAGHPELLMFRKLFHVLPCDWEITTISETLDGVTVDNPQRNFYIEKPNGVIFIDGTYEAEVPSGEYTQYTIGYGSTDFSESDVTIHTEFPQQAPFANAYMFPDRWDADEGSWAEWDVGLVSPANEGEIDVTVFVLPEIPVSNTVDIRNEIWDHLDRVLDVFTVTYHITEPELASWEKWVDGEPWQLGMERTVETSDTVTVVDVLDIPTDQPITLIEEWTGGELGFLEYEANNGDVTLGDDFLVWEVQPGHPGTVAITKTFHIEPCNWSFTTFRETLIGLEVAFPERQVILNKRGHDLHLSEVHFPEAFPGEVANFTLIYSNNGGYENDVLIINQFPPEAQFISSVPEPSIVEPFFVIWELGDLATGSEGTIDVLVEISEEAVLSSTIIITDSIIDHTGEVVKDVTIDYFVKEYFGYRWEKYINGDSWYPGITAHVETSDTITVEEVIYREAGFPITFELNEQYTPEELQLLDWDLGPETWGEVTTSTYQGKEYLNWSIPPDGPSVITLTLWFHVEPSTWAVTYLNDELTSVVYYEVRGAAVEKVQPDLWIDSVYIQDVLSGEYATFLLQYGNNGGYENNVAIGNAFPPEAPFISSVPAPTSITPDYVFWEVGDLGMGSEGTIEVTVQITEGLQVSTTLEIVDWIFNHVYQPVDVVTTTFHIAEEGVRLPELGDAPDSSNHAGVPMTAYHFPPAPPVMANYSTVYDPATGLPSGPLHFNPRGDAWLGEWVTLEFDADLPPDEDTITNLDPPANVPDLDFADDGVVLPQSLPDCAPTVLNFTVNVPEGVPPADRFVNVWIDWDRDGDWADTFTCEQQGDAPEWAVQNLLLPPLPLGFHFLQTPVFLPHNKTPGLPTWLRITLATQPAPLGPDGSPPDGRGPVNGYTFGETEDYWIPGVEPVIPKWEKWIEIEGIHIPWNPDLMLSVETSDTIQVVDVFHGEGAFTLVESWHPEHLQLQDWSVEPPEGVIVDPAGSFLYWVVGPDHSETITMTKLFHIKESTWLDTLLDERLLVNGEMVGAQPVRILKRPSRLWIDSSYEREVQADDVVPFFLQFGNDGGFENNVTIRNEFPPEAPFVETIPPPARWDPAGLWAEWDLEALGSEVSGQIEVLVQIMPGLQPSTTIEIWDGIFNHMDELVDEVVTTFHVNFPPVGSIFGHKWFDLNNNGERDPEEPGLPDWEIYVSGENGIPESTSTDENGDYRFLNLPVGTYTVTEEIKEGWTQTFPQEGYHVVVLKPGQHVEGLDFGNYQSLIGWVDGYVYDSELPGNQPTCTPANVLAIPGGLLIPADPTTGYYGPQPLLENTYTLIANAPGYGPKNALVDVIRGITTTQDFYLPRPTIVISSTSDPVSVTIDVGDSFTYPIDIVNEGHLPLEFEMIELGGVDIPWVAEDPISGTIPGLSSQQIDIMLTCEEAGTFTGTLGISHNDPCQPPVEVSLELYCREPLPITWQKWVDDIAWTPGFTITRQTSDTIVVVDTFSGSGAFTLIETWDGSRLGLLGWELEPEDIGIIDPTEFSLHWVVPADRPETVTITKWFHVEPSTWISTTLTEVVWIGPEPVIEREVTVLKMPYRLYLPLIFGTSPQEPTSMFQTLWDRWTIWANDNHSYRWLEILNRVSYHPRIKPAS